MRGGADALREAVRSPRPQADIVPQKRTFLKTHSALRGVAATLVIFYHLKFGTSYRLPLETATSFFDRGYLWVDVFFVLSGFVISHAYLPAKGSMTLVATRAYLVSRIARIYPLHITILLILLLFYVMVSIAQQRADPHLQAAGLYNLFSTLALTQTWLGSVGPNLDWNVPSWSISAEMQVYLLFPLIAWGIATAERLALLVLSIFAAGFYLWIGANGSLDIIDQAAVVRCCAGFCLGVLCFRVTPILSVVPAAVLSIIQTLAFAIIVITMAAGLPDILVPPAAFLLVWATATDQGILTRLLSHRAALWMGQLSYAIYLVHVPVIIVMAFFWSRGMKAMHVAEGPASRMLWISTILLLVIVSASLLHHWVEVPSRSFFRNMSDVRSRKAKNKPTSTT